ncbi:hypothetical protein B0H63DRAFT_161577 [Podospora didyma]|uniref:Peptidase S54 rhomboid domain-containing protein n=1 Tax=Podospora didyma TaxID=330526 RepID=A0AAE0U1J3_9PEZI|nr:hypothetical protein B0H63DRAFT_161577 [Podospora didyma]
MSFTSAPVTRALVLGLVASSVAASLLDVKHYFYISVGTHILRYRQLWRLLTYQLCYTNSSEVLFAAMALYNMRTIEQLWGSRKYASFLAVTSLFTAIIPPLLLTAVIRPLSFGKFEYLPAGPTPIIFAILAQYHAIIPHTYKYKVALSTSPPTNGDALGVTVSDKSLKYFMVFQLALFQLPGSLLGAMVGWVVGYSWRNELLPGRLTRWRIPGWVVGLRSKKRNGGFEGMRRRLEGESEGSASAGIASGAQPSGNGEGENRRRTMGQQLLDEVRGAF